jgi:hypothetical protein
MFAAGTAVGEHVFVGAAGGHERVGKEREAVEGAVVVDVLCELRDGGIVPSKPSGIDDYWSVGVAEDAINQVRLD